MKRFACMSAAVVSGAVLSLAPLNTGLAQQALPTTTIEYGLIAGILSIGPVQLAARASAEKTAVSGNGTVDQSWQTPMDTHDAGVRLLRAHDVTEHLEACSSTTCQAAHATTIAHEVDLLGLVQIGSIVDDIDFNVVTLKRSGSVTVASVRINGVPVADISRHFPPAPGDTPEGTSYAVTGLVDRRFINLLGLVVTTKVPFSGELTVGNVTGDIYPPPNGNITLDHEVALSLTGHLDGAVGLPILVPPADVTIALGDVHVTTTGSSAQAFATGAR